MNAFLQSIDDIRLDARTKGLPIAEGEIRLGDVAGRRWNVVKGDMTLPLLTLSDAAVANNLKIMREFAAAHGVSIAPHGKTTGCPQLFRRQMEEGGAWGLTGATGQQAALAALSGVPNVLIANEVVSPANVRQLVGLQKAHPGTSFYSLVDSVDGVLRFADFARPALRAGARLKVLVELGAEGGRAGARRMEDAEAILAALRGEGDVLQLAGVECYEGAVSRESELATLAAIGRLLDFAVAVYRKAAEQRAFAGLAETLISAGGTIYFDEVVRRFEPLRSTPGLRILLRGGAYLALDHGFYLRNAKAMDRRGPIATSSGPRLASEAFRPALELWAAVLSLKDKGVAIMNMGMRDLPYDIDLPVPLKLHRDGRPLRDLTASNAPWKVIKANDQHCFLSYPEGSDIKVGDVVSFGISHTSTAFDKWSVLYRIDEEGTVTGALKTFF